MNKLKGVYHVLLMTACTFGLVARACAFGHEGHEAVAILALQKLNTDAANNNTKAKAALQHITGLLGNTDLAAVAVWADCIRISSLHCASASEIADIDARFRTNGDWHFVDLPLHEPAYSNNAESANENDVVHGINKCIAMLESADTSTEQDHHAVALKFLVHLAGDIHQPLHVACGYYRLHSKGIVRDPATISINHLPDDRGGNHLLSTTSPSSANLHHLWDSDLVFIQAGSHASVPGSQVAQALAAALGPNLFPPQSGDHHGWAANWATDSRAAAALAYTGIKVPRITALTSHGTEIADTTMTDFVKADYITAHQAAARRQLLKAAWRLAELLENIDWHN